VCRELCLLKDFLAWYPPVGVYIAILALLGVIVPLFRKFEEIGRRERAIWTLIMFVLVGLEIRSIYLDRNAHDREQAAARKEQLEKFKDISDGLRASIDQSQAQFQATVVRFEGVTGLEKLTATTASEAYKATTGGDSFCVMAMQPDVEGLSFAHNGKYPLYNVSVSVVDLDKQMAIWKEHEGGQPYVGQEAWGGYRVFRVGDIHPNTAAGVPLTIESSRADRLNLNISFIARNGHWSQQLRFRKVGGKWVSATNVYSGWKPQKEIYFYADPEYPHTPDGRVDWRVIP
jgi:hypothetical protein